MKFKFFYFLTIAASIVGLAIWLLKVNASSYDYRSEAEEATGAMLSIYLEEGLLGLIAVSKECYEHEKIKPEVCFTHDVASKVWDRGVTQAMKLPTEDYFDDENIIQRLLDRDQGKTFTQSDAISFIPKITIVVEGRIPVEWNLQKHKFND